MNANRATVRISMVTKSIAIGALILAIAGSSAGLYFRFGRPKNELVFPGTVETQEVHLSSRTGGRVSKVFVREGKIVEAGQPIVELEMPELDAQRASLVAQKDAAEAILERLKNGPRPEELAAAAAAVAAAQARVDRMEKGYRQEEIEQARSEVASLEADQENARLELNRERSLAQTGASTGQAYDAAVARYGRLQAQVAAAEARLQMLEKGYRIEEVAETRAELAQLQANYDLLKAGTRQEEIDEAKAKIENLNAQIAEVDVKRRERTVIAPERAIVEIVSVRPGDTVAPNEPVARVLRADDLWVKAYISEVDLGHLQLGDKVTVTMDTFPNKRFQGVVTYIASASEFTPRNIQTIDERRHQVFGFRVRVEDPQGIFKSGMAAEVQLPIDRPGDPKAT